MFRSLFNKNPDISTFITFYLPLLNLNKFIFPIFSRFRGYLLQKLVKCNLFCIRLQHKWIKINVSVKLKLVVLEII